MAKYCVMLPQVRNMSNNELEQSELFKDLLKVTKDRSYTIEVWAYTRSDEFKERFPTYPKTEQGEPTLEFIDYHGDLGDKIGLETFLENLNKNEHTIKSDGTFYSFGTDVVAAEEKAKKFNKTHPLRNRYFMSTEKAQRAGGIAVIYYNKIKRASVMREKDFRQYQIEENKEKVNEVLNTKIKEKLSQFGISIGALTALEERMKVNGVYDASIVEEVVNGMTELIRLAKGERGEKALPEEFAHFIIDALEEHPLIQRYLSTLVSTELVQDILGEEYDRYMEVYEGDTKLVAKEALGKLLTKHLLQQEPITNTTPNVSLFKRVFELIKNFLTGKNFTSFAKDIQEEKVLLDTELSVFAKRLMNGKYDLQIDKKNLNSKEKYYQFAKQAKPLPELLKYIIDMEVKRKALYENRQRLSYLDLPKDDEITLLEDKALRDEYIEGINIWIENTSDKLVEFRKEIDELIEQGSDMSALFLASQIRSKKDYISAYAAIQGEIRQAVNESRRGDKKLEQEIGKSLNAIDGLIRSIQQDFEEVSVPILVKFLEPLVGNSFEILKKNLGKNITLEDLLRQTDGDITWADMMLNAMGDSNDVLLQLYDKAVKQYKEEIRLKVIEKTKELQAEQLKLESKGITDTVWMLEKYKDGTFTGNYVSPINEAQYRKDRAEFFAKMKEKYRDSMLTDRREEYIKERDTWNMEHRDEEGVPKASLYANPEYTKIQQNAAKKTYYDNIIKIKEELDSFLPEKYTKDGVFKAVQVKKGLVDRVKNSSSVKNGAKEIFEAIKDEWVRVEDDNEFNEVGVTYANSDFEGNKVLTLPVYFTKRLNNTNDISTDITASMTAYASMALNFDGMHDLVDILELGRNALKTRQINVKKGDKKVVEEIRAMGRKVTSAVYKKGEVSNILEKYDKWMLMQVYGQLKADEKLAKQADALLKIVSFKNLGFNYLQNISNVATGSTVMMIETLGKQYFDGKDLVNSDLIYTKEIVPKLAEITDRLKTNKLDLFGEMFNVEDEGALSRGHVTMNKKDWIAKGFNPVTISFLGMKAGEHWMHYRTALALSERLKLRDSNGVSHSLYDSLEVVREDENGKTVKAYLKVKDGYTKEDGSAFTNKDIAGFTLKCSAINRAMHGTYNEMDKNMAQYYALGRMAMGFRKWMVDNFNKRFQHGKYNFSTEDYKEGYYGTMGKFIWSTYKEIRAGQFHLITKWDSMEQWERANMVKSISELTFFLALSLSLALLDFGEGKNRPWALKALQYQLSRLQLEIGAMTPNPMFVKNALKLLSSPAAGISYLETASGLLDVFDYFDTIESGRYRGRYKITKTMGDLVPGVNAIYRTLHPEVGLTFLRQY